MIPAPSPAVLFLDEVCEKLRISQRTAFRLRRHGCFPIPEIPSLDRRPRFSALAVDAFLAQSRHVSQSRRLRTFGKR